MYIKYRKCSIQHIILFVQGDIRQKVFFIYLMINTVPLIVTFVKILMKCITCQKQNQNGIDG